MSTATAFNADEALQENPKPFEIVSATTALVEDQSSLLFSSLPTDLVLNVLARVPRRYHPILSCVSRKLRSLVRSSELHQTRSLLGKDSFYVCFEERELHQTPSLHAEDSFTYHWFTLIDNRLVSIPFPSPPDKYYTAARMIGPEIYFVGGPCDFPKPSSMWIMDSRSGKLREGPSSRVACYFAAVGLVDDKIYNFGGCQGYRGIHAEVFDTKTQTWEVAPKPSVEMQRICMSVVSPSLDRKIYARCRGQVIIYDPRYGNCEKIYMPDDESCSKDVCVIDNLMYIYYSRVGLIWYDFKDKVWRVVKGLKLNGYSASKVAIVEHNGKLVSMRERSIKKKKQIWCSMIALDRSAVEIIGKVEWFDRVLTLGRTCMIRHCFGRTD